MILYHKNNIIYKILKYNLKNRSYDRFSYLPRLLKQPAATDFVFGEVCELLSKLDALEATLFEVRMPFFDIGSSFSFCSRK